MSVVTNCILSIGIMEAEKEALSYINTFGHGHSFVSVDDENVPEGWYGGTKMFEANLFLAAINYFQKEAFYAHLNAYKWEFPEEVQMIIKGQDDDVFSIEHPCPPIASSSRK